MLKTVLVPIHREGWPFIALFAVVSAVLFAIFEPLGWLGVLATAWCIYFFRDPDRVTPIRDGLIVSPADGVVLPLVEMVPPPELGLDETPRTRVSIFMNVFDVHVNRTPCDATVVGTKYVPGKFVNASFDKASEHNERMALRLRMKQGAPGPEGEIGMIQIAGLVARRIKCYVAEGAALAAGERFGIIRFGSRVDVYLPPGIVAAVAAGQRSVAGETVIADLRAQEPIRGEVR